MNAMRSAWRHLLLIAVFAGMPAIAAPAPSCPDAAQSASATPAAPWQGSALHRAVLDRNQASVRKLLAAGADPNGKDNWGFAPLFAAVSLTPHEPDPTPPSVQAVLARREREEREKLAIFRLLMKAKPDLTLRAPGGITVLHQATSPTGAMDRRYAVPITERLLAAGAEIDAQDDAGFTPLMNAASRDRADLVAVLLRTGARADLRNCRGETAVDLARYSHAEHTLPLLLKAGR